MIQPNAEYVCETTEGSWRISGSRVSLDSLVHAYWQGQSAEMIAADFPSLTLEQVHGAIAFYLRHQSEIDEYLTKQDATWSKLRAESHQRNAALLDRLRAARDAAIRQEPPR